MFLALERDSPRWTRVDALPCAQVTCLEWVLELLRAETAGANAAASAQALRALVHCATPRAVRRGRDSGGLDASLV